MRLTGPSSYLVARHLYEGLTRYDPERQTAVPASAASWRVERGGRRFVFLLRSGLTFHDGSPVTASDFVFSFDRIARKANASELAFTLRLVKGFKAVNRSGTADHLSGLQARDETTLVIELSEPYQDLPLVLTHPALAPLSRRAVKDFDSFLRQPVGNGPFELVQPWAPGRPLILEALGAFPEAPEVDGIRFLSYPDAAASWVDFVDGELELAKVPVDQFDQAEEVYGSRGFRPLLSGYYYGLNLRAGGLNNRQLRLALNRAIDRQAIASGVFKDSMEPARGIVPAGVPGFDGSACSALCNYSPKDARGLVAGLPRKQRRIEMQYTAGSPHDEVAAAVAEDLRAVGLSVRLRALGFDDHLRLIERGKHAVFRLSWIAEYPLADVFLSPLFASKSPDNHFGVTSKKIDALLMRAHREPNEGARRSLYLQAEREILRRIPLIPIGSFTTHWVAQRGVRGVVFDNLGGFDATGVSLDD